MSAIIDERTCSSRHRILNGRGVIPVICFPVERCIFSAFYMLIALYLPFMHVHAGEIVHPYKLIDPPIQVHESGYIEVVEWFWYASPDGYILSSALAEWAKPLPDDVLLHRMPAVLKDDWAILADVYFAFEQMGIDEKMHARTYHAVVKQGLNWSDERFLFDWVDREGVDVAAFASTFRSASVYKKRLQATHLGKDIGLKSVPAFLVQGKYMITPELAGGIEYIPRTLEKIIAQARQELKSQ
ncbi:MAG: thiol:disulfide interchange protein DsbA/DsbL [Mariprofundaceae bacterium]